MWQGSYGKEPFNLRLTVLRMIYKIPVIAGITLLGTVLFGGGYYVKNVLLRGESLYAATSTYRVEYAVEEEKDVGTVYINQYSWNTYLQTDMFLSGVKGHLLEELANSSLTPATEGSVPVTDLIQQDLGAYLSAALASDLRMPTITVTHENPDVAVRLAKAVEATMIQKMPAEIREIVSIYVIDSPLTAEEIVPDVRVGRALILSAVLSCFFALVFFLLKETWEDGIWLPNSIWKRYGVRTVGYLAGQEIAQEEHAGDTDGLKAIGKGRSNELAENLAYFLGGKSKVAICPVTKDVNPEEVLQSLKGGCPETVTDEWFALPAPEICPEVCEQLHRAEGILLAVPAGAHSGRKVEWTLEYLRQQDCEVTAALLVDADGTLIRNYYRLGRD